MGVLLRFPAFPHHFDFVRSYEEIIMPVTESPSPNLFWGIVLKADKRYEQTVEECFHISKACIEPTLNNGKICSVYLEQDNEEFILCNLSQKNLNESLDLNFTEGEKICFRVEGGGTVHLTGYLVPDEDDSPMWPMDDDVPSDVEDEEEEEETPPKLVKKRKLENGDAPKAKSKKEAEIKQAEAMKKILAKENGAKDSDEESDDDDSEEDDMDDSELKSGSSFFDTTNDSDEDEEDSDEDEDEEEDDSEEEDDEDSKTEAPGKKTPAKDNSKTPNGKQKKESPKSQKKEKSETPKPNKVEKKLETPNQKKETKPEVKTETPATAKKDKKNKQLQNGTSTNGPATPAAQTPKNKDAKTPQANQPQKTPKKQLKGGLMVEDLKVGNGPEAKSGKLVGMYYEGKLKANNKQFDAQKSGKPFRFRLGRGEVIKGWDVGVDGMKVGGKRRLTVPPQMGYGSQGAPPDIPPNATLVFEVECKMVN